MLKRPVPGQMCGPADKPFSDRSFESEFPTLHEYLTVTSWGDRQPRTTSTLLLFVDNGALKCCINDRDNNRSAFVNDTTFAGLLALLESKLTEESLDWRTKGSGGAAGGKIPF